MHRIADSDVFPLLASFVYPSDKMEDVRNRIRSFKTVREFQHDTMRRVNEQIIARSITDFSVSGLERLSPDKHYLFISNHRDIMLDASLLQYYFVVNGFDTTEITFGANLMMHPVVIDVGKCNKMFKVARPGGDIKEFYRNSMHLSEYIRFTIKEKGQSVWIAQRNGRTKDGIDRTEPALVKMISYSGDRKNPVESLAEMNIVPISISYEWEPCAWMKAREMAMREQGPYTKEAGEDTRSIISGITGQKGRVHLSICKPLGHEELEAMNGDFHKVAQLIDQRIAEAYRLWPNNLIARHMLDADCPMAPATDEERKAFADYVDQACKEMGMGGEFRSWLLKIYAGNMGGTTRQEQ